MQTSGCILRCWGRGTLAVRARVGKRRRMGLARRQALQAQEAHEPGFEFLVAEEHLRLSRAAVLAASRIVIQQELRGFDEHLARRLAGLDRDQLEPRSLVVIQFNFHKVKPMLWGHGAVN